MTTPSVGVVGDESVAERLSDDGVAVERHADGTVPETETVVAVGQAALSAVADTDSDPLVLPVDAGRGVRSVARESITAAVRGLDGARTERHYTLSITRGGECVGRTVWDTTLVTEDAARISEFAITTPTDTIDAFRADGVVVATPAGSPGYARRVGGPVLAPSPVAVVAPIAPFATNPDHWVVPVDELTLSVERDEATVSLLVDDDRAGTVARGESVTLSESDPIRVAVVAESRPRFA
ncbi:ATP-NAD kinase [Haloarcula pelagica]|uniref:ATP-NAD kinase n=1 Tax=Haloarcula pelagica TaxID=3033389 RepID=UPI0024C311CC|nr:ATP-NAD kinase [Halomicroarcula sp. YJ-61-S]